MARYREKVRKYLSHWVNLSDDDIDEFIEAVERAQKEMEDED